MKAYFLIIAITVCNLLLTTGCGGNNSNDNLDENANESVNTDTPSDTNNSLNDDANQTFQIGAFNAVWDNLQLRIEHSDRTIWESKNTVDAENLSFIAAGIHALHADENRGSFLIEERTQSLCDKQQITSITQQETKLVITGHVTGVIDCDTDFKLKIQEKKDGQ